MDTKDFKFTNQRFNSYIDWQELLESKEPILKKYVVWVKGFDYYAGGVTGVHRWTHFKVLNGTGWNSRQEAWEWCKRSGNKPFCVHSNDPTGRGAKAQDVKIMRLDKFIKYILSDECWYEKQTYTLPDSAELVF